MATVAEKAKGRRSHKLGEREGKASKVFKNFRGGEMETALFLKIRGYKKLEVSWLGIKNSDRFGKGKKKEKKGDTEKQKLDPIRVITRGNFYGHGKIELN